MRDKCSVFDTQTPVSFDWQFGDIGLRLLRLRHAVGQSAFRVAKFESVAVGATFLRYDCLSLKQSCESVESSGMMSVTRISIDQAKEMLQTRAASHMHLHPWT